MPRRPVMIGGMHTPCLPVPTAPFPVGTTSLWLTDTSRPDPWAADVSVRELMVSLWYPAASADGQRARYMTAAESRLLLAGAGITGVPPDALSTVRTNAAVDATPAGRQGSLPLIVLSPGFTHPRSALTGLAEDLASHGYVAAGIGHTYESHATAFPDGRVTTCLAREAPRHGRQEKVVAGRAADVRFVLGELTGAHPAWPGAELIDPSRIAMAGHSMGGAAAIAAMLADSRIRAGIDMDGATAAPIPDHGLSRPFLFLGKQSNYTPGSGGAVTPGTREWKLLRGSVTTWERDWKLLAAGSGGSWWPARSTPPSPTWRSWPVNSASTSTPAFPEPGPWTSPAPTSGPSSTSTCAAGRKPCSTSRHRATPRSRSVPRKPNLTWATTALLERPGFRTGVSGQRSRHSRAFTFLNLRRRVRSRVFVEGGFVGAHRGYDRRSLRGCERGQHLGPGGGAAGKPLGDRG
jgi:dienelactone hydrolase